MYTLNIKNWFHTPNLPRFSRWHDFIAYVNDRIHDRQFWAKFGVMALVTFFVAMFVALFVWSIKHPELNRSITESVPYMFN